MELKDTVDLMLSCNYKDRLLAEYMQAKIRAEGLNKFIREYAQGNLGFNPDCDMALLQDQLRVMVSYILTLQNRIKAEHVDLTISTISVLEIVDMMNASMINFNKKED